MFEIKTPDHPYEQNELNEFNFCKCGVAKRLHKDTPDKRVEEWEAVRWRVVSNVQTGRMSLADAEAELDKTLTQYHQDLIEDILKMADALEVECGKDGDKGTKQWMAFKGFRNTIRDKYIIKLSK